MTTITPGVVGDYLVEVAEYTVTDGIPQEPSEFIRLNGLTKITPPKVEKNLEDDGEIDGTYWGSQVATGLSWTSEGTVKIPRATLADDPGQAICKKAGKGVAEEGLVWVRFTKRGATAAEQGVADVTWAEEGGEKTALTTAAVTFTGRGALVDVQVTAAEDPALPDA